MALNDKTKHNKKWRELYDRIKEVLGKFGEDREAGAGDYFVVDDVIDSNTHLLEINKLHMYAGQDATSR